MVKHLENFIMQCTGAEKISRSRVIQDLWQGYGKLYRFVLKGGNHTSVIAKHIQYPEGKSNSRNLSHQRKVRSYQVEIHWYERWAGRCNSLCRVPDLLGVHTEGTEIILVLEDLDSCGFSKRHSTANEQIAKLGVRWLANFHAAFMQESPSGLWETGTYWHLSTRREELNRLNDSELKTAAHKIDQKLHSTDFKTIVHGDAKLENFCFSKNCRSAAAVDFQYTGGGCGIRDFAYFLDSCFPEETVERIAEPMLKFYFSELKNALVKYEKTIDTSKLEKQWWELFPVAWADFYRFLRGWSGGRWNGGKFTQRLIKEVLEDLGDENDHKIQQKEHV